MAYLYLHICYLVIICAIDATLLLKKTTQNRIKEYQ